MAEHEPVPVAGAESPERFAGARRALRAASAHVVALARLTARVDEGVHAGAEATARLVVGAAAAAAWIDRRVVDRAVEVVGAALTAGSLLLRGAQTGNVQSYALAVVLGLVALVILLDWSLIAGLVARLGGGR